MTRPVPAIVALFRKAREERGISQPDMAKRLNVHPCVVRDFERGRSNMGMVKVERKFAALDLELAVVPIDPGKRAQEAADWLMAQGWKVEGPDA